MELLSHGDAIKLAQALVSFGVVSPAPEGEVFQFRGGWLSPMKVHMDIAFDSPELSKQMELSLVPAMQQHMLPYTTIPGSVMTFAGVPRGGVPIARMLAPHFHARHCAVTKVVRDSDVDFCISELATGERCVVVTEDVLTTASMSSRLIHKFVSAYNRTPKILLTSFSYGFAQAQDALAVFGVEHVNHVPFSALYQAMAESDKFTSEFLRTVHDWRCDPVSWSASRLNLPRR